MKRVLATFMGIALLLCSIGCRTAPQSSEGQMQQLPSTDTSSEPMNEGDADRKGGMMIDPAPPSVAQERTPVEDYADFAALVSAAYLYGTDQNKMISPVSLYMALAMVAQAASGDTQAELMNLLGEDSAQSLNLSADLINRTIVQENKDALLTIANALWCNKNLGVKDEFKTMVENSYGADVFDVLMNNADTWEQMSQWVSDNTKGTLVPDFQFDDLDLLVLMSTIYLKDAWAEPFDKNSNSDDVFTKADGTTVTATYMHKSFLDSTLYLGDSFARFTLQTGTLGAKVHFILPLEGYSANDFLTNPQTFENALLGGKEETFSVDVSLPTFSFEDEMELNGLLDSLGVHRAFDLDKAEFSNATDDDAYLSKVAQQTCISIDEQGIEASGFTEAVISTRGINISHSPKYDFSLDRPFIFAITSANGTVLFVGVVNDPTQN